METQTPIPGKTEPFPDAPKPEKPKPKFKSKIGAKHAAKPRLKK